MPTYEYQCRKCHRVFEKVMTISDHEHKRKPACPKCGSRAVRQRICEVAVTTDKKT